jgi:hypothetical protein
MIYQVVRAGMVLRHHGRLSLAHEVCHVGEDANEDESTVYSQVIGYAWVISNSFPTTNLALPR